MKVLYISLTDIVSEKTGLHQPQNARQNHNINPGVISQLRKIKYSGVSLVLLSPTDITRTTSYLTEELISLFDTIYLGDCLHRYIVKEKSFDKNFEALVSNIFLQELEVTKTRCEYILSKYNRFSIVDKEYCIGLKSMQVPKEVLEGSEYFQVILDELAKYGMKVFLSPNKSDYIIEYIDSSRLCKSTSIAYDRKQRGESFAVCIGSSIQDYNMLGVVNIGIFPQELIDKLIKVSTFSHMGSNASKLVMTPLGDFSRMFLNEAATVFAKADKNLL